MSTEHILRCLTAVFLNIFASHLSFKIYVAGREFTAFALLSGAWIRTMRSVARGHLLLGQRLHWVAKRSSFGKSNATC